MSGKLSAGSSPRAYLLAGAAALLAMAGPPAARAQNLTPGIIGSTYTAVYSDTDFPFNPPVSGGPPCLVSLTLECSVNPGFFQGFINAGPYDLGFTVFSVPFLQQYNQVELDFVGAPPIVDATIVQPPPDFADASVTFTPTSVTFFLQGFLPLQFEPQVVGVDLTLPEPGSLAIFGCGLLGLGWLRRRRRSDTG